MPTQCACERTKSVTWESSPALDLGAVIEGNCVLARGGGEQPEVNDQSVTKVNTIRPAAAASLLGNGEVQDAVYPAHRVNKAVAVSLG